MEYCHPNVHLERPLCQFIELPTKQKQNYKKKRSIKLRNKTYGTETQKKFANMKWDHLYFFVPSMRNLSVSHFDDFSLQPIQLMVITIYENVLHYFNFHCSARRNSLTLLKFFFSSMLRKHVFQFHYFYFFEYIYLFSTIHFLHTYTYMLKLYFFCVIFWTIDCCFSELIINEYLEGDFTFGSITTNLTLARLCIYKGLRQFVVFVCARVIFWFFLLVCSNKCSHFNMTTIYTLHMYVWCICMIVFFFVSSS